MAKRDGLDGPAPGEAMTSSGASRPIVVAAEGGDRCTCGWPDVACLARTLRNGPPYPETPCEPAITLAEHQRRQTEADRGE